MVRRRDYALSVEERAEARSALRILEGSGISLSEAARRAVDAAGVGVVTLLDGAIDGFIVRCLRVELRRSTINYYEDCLHAFSRAFPERTLDDFSRGELKRWFEGLPVSAATARAQYRAVRAMFRWAAKQDPPLVVRDPTVSLHLELGSGSKRIEVLSVQECEAIMRGAGPYRAALALMLFAGVRPYEVADRHKEYLQWRHVDRESRIVRVPASIAKTGRPRVLEGLPDAFWEWVGPAGDGAISPGRSRQAIARARAVMNRPWPQDGLRHSFASYHLAAFEDISRVCLLLGHEGSPQLLYNHYRGLVTRSEAVAFWALRP